VRARNNGTSSQAGDVHRQWDDRVKARSKPLAGVAHHPDGSGGAVPEEPCEGDMSNAKKPANEGAGTPERRRWDHPRPADAADIMMAFPIMAFPAWSFAETAPNKVAAHGAL
jgi:hypothetical protein